MNRNTDDLYNKMANLCTRYNYFFERYVEKGEEKDLLLSYKIYGALEAYAQIGGLDLDYKRIGDCGLDIAYCPKDKVYIVFIADKAFTLIPYKELTKSKLYELSKGVISGKRIKKNREQIKDEIKMLIGVDVKNLEFLKDSRAELARFYLPIFKRLEAMEQRIVKLKLKGLKNTEIAKEEKICKQYVSKIFMKVLNKLETFCNEEPRTEKSKQKDVI